MKPKQSVLGGVARAVLASAIVGLGCLAATSASAALTSSQLADANTLAELIVDATQQANSTPDNPNTAADETRIAIQGAVESTIEGFQSGNAEPAIVSEALFLAKAKMLGANQWCPETMATTKPSMKSRAAPELERSCAMGQAFASIATAVQTAQNTPPSSTDAPGNLGPAAIPPPTGAGGGGGGVVHPPSQ